MGVRSKQLLTGRSGTAGSANTYVNASGETTIVKNVLLSWRSATAGTVTIKFVTVGPTTVVFTLPMVNQQTIRMDEIWWVLQGTDELRVEATVTDGCWFLVSGAQLEGEAD